MTTASAAASSALPPAASAIYEAERAPGPSGAVLYGVVIDFDAAVARRKTGEDVVVRGGNHKVMRFFTGDLFERRQSADEAVLDASETEWESALQGYHPHLPALLPALPPHLCASPDLLLHHA